MKPLQDAYCKHSACVWASCFDDRPGKLFDGLQHIRATILLSETNRDANSAIIYTTNLLRWPTETRDTLFSRLCFGLAPSSMVMSGSFPKASDPELCGLLEKIWALPDRLEQLYDSRSTNIVYYYRSPLYWIRAMDFLPHFASDSANRSVHHFKDFPVKHSRYAGLIGCIINSTTFYIWFVAYGNGRNVTLRDITSFPIPSSLINLHESNKFQELFSQLMKDYRKNSIVRKRQDGVEFEEFKPGKSKPVMDEIDCELSKYFNFTPEELDFIINYDGKFRMGIEEEVD